MHRTLLLTSALLLALCAAGARLTPAQNQPAANQNDQTGQNVQSPFPETYVPPGSMIFKSYCAACHGVDAKGHGPVTRMFKTPAPDLTSLAKRHGGKFPYEYVAGVLRFGPGVPSHGTGDMPTWGPLFDYYYGQNPARQRIKNLSDYLASLQVK